MGGSLNYYDLAENDYQFLSYDYEHERVGNIMCSSAQNICERYLKHLIDCECRGIDTSTVLHSHSLKSIRNFIKENLSDFECDWDKVMKADGYYFTTRYPGDDAFLVNKDDVNDCWEAVKYTRSLVEKRCDSKGLNKGNADCNANDENDQSDNDDSP